MASTSTKKQRDHALDTIRIIAILDIVICHIAAGSFPAGIIQQILVALGSLGVPLFVMLTGYLMLDRTYDATYIRRFLKRNLLPLFVSLEAWNVIWFFLSHFIGNTPMRVSTLLKVATFTGDSGTGFWFLPMIFALYLGIPIVSSALHYFISQQSRAYLYILIFCAVFFGTVIPTCTELLAWVPGHHEITSVLQMNIFGTDIWGRRCGYCICYSALCSSTSAQPSSAYPRGYSPSSSSSFSRSRPCCTSAPGRAISPATLTTPISPWSFPLRLSSRSCIEFSSSRPVFRKNSSRSMHNFPNFLLAST
ncbi:acyltransferase [Bifidobacterium sp. ESL0798]|uniref:acyltransferase n=1 Tax=Bifidobacterium sp. ESL0798 TaxID=2983235 RepID=UPI0023F7DB64|nr:acyltransferase [Bifidobacterium sp. ESL0798]WEV73873.1 acyltransferase [Bifidobacterium sp. ESL0798]